MSANRRIFYAVQSVGMAQDGTNTFTMMKGIQSLGINTKFNLEQIFEIGQLQIYENLENIPDIEVTLEKVIDGTIPIYCLATKGSSSKTISGRSNVKAALGLSIYSDVQESASGTPLAQCTMSGVYVSAVNYNFDVNGNSTESVTLVGNNKMWSNTFTAAAFTNDDSPAAPEGVNRRQDVLFGSAGCILPPDIPGISASGTNDLDATGDSYNAHIQTIKVSANLGRQQLFELGHKGPYHRYVSFPVEVTTEIEAISTQGDNITALQEINNLTTRQIVLKTRDGLVVDCGVKNKLSSVTYGGANAATNGGNATATYTFTTYNDMTVTHPADV